MVQLVNEGYAGALHVTDAAAACGCSPSHFMRWFRQMTGQSFIAFLNEYRLNTAAEALRTTDETVLTIASRCGFENLSYFNRAFKAHFGMTPGTTGKISKALDSCGCMAYDVGRRAAFGRLFPERKVSQF